MTLRVSIEVSCPAGPAGRVREVDDTPRTRTWIDRGWLKLLDTLADASDTTAAPEPEPEPVDDDTDDTDTYPVAAGGGWYELSDGTSVRGRAEAEAAQADLDDAAELTTSVDDIVDDDVSRPDTTDEDNGP